MTRRMQEWRRNRAPRPTRADIARAMDPQTLRDYESSRAYAQAYRAYARAREAGELDPPSITFDEYLHRVPGQGE